MSDSFSVQSMAEALTADREKSGHKTKIYKEIADQHKGQQISLSITSKNNALKQSINAPRVDLSDTQEVQKRIFMYLEACSLSSSFPSVMGLAAALGCSRQNLNRWLLSHANHTTTDFINIAKDLIADVLTDAALRNNAAQIMAIFQLKNLHGFADRVEVAPVTPERDDRDYDPEDIRKRYLSSCMDADADEQ